MYLQFHQSTAVTFEVGVVDFTHCLNIFISNFPSYRTFIGHQKLIKKPEKIFSLLHIYFTISNIASGHAHMCLFDTFWVGKTCFNTNDMK